MSRNRNRNRNSQAPLTQDETKTAVGADRDKPFLFSEGGKTYKLPPARDAIANMEAGAMIDAALDGTERAWIQYSLRLLMSSGVDDATMQALRKMKGPKFTQTLMRWMKQAGAEVGK